LMLYCSEAQSVPHSKSMKGMSLRVGRPFSKVYTSPQDEEFPPFSMETLNLGHTQTLAGNGNKFTTLGFSEELSLEKAYDYNQLN